MANDSKKLKIVYLTPALYMAGGVERVLTLKANYFAEHFGYDITIVLTEGKDKPLFYPLSDKIKTVNLDIGFEQLWTCSFMKKIFVYMKKQHQYRRKVKAFLMETKPDVMVSLLRREINFITSIHDGSRKIGEMHINRANYRNFDADSNVLKRMFSKLWMHNLVGKLRRLDRLVVLTEKDREAWTELNNVEVIPDPLSFTPRQTSRQTEKRVVAVARYSHEKGIDLLLKAWKHTDTDWRLDVFGDGDRTPYEELIEQLNIDRSRCQLHPRTNDVEREYCGSSLFVLSSRFEGFGMVMTEAMACGLPVVAFDCPWGPRSIIRNGEDGLLAENGDTAALAKAMERLMSDDTLRRRMSQAAKTNVQRFSTERVAQMWQKVYETVTNSKQNDNNSCEK